MAKHGEFSKDIGLTGKATETLEKLLVKIAEKHAISGREDSKMKIKKWKVRGMVLGVSLWFFSSFLSGTIFGAEKDFPNKEITFIVSLGAGGARDSLARGLSKTMSKYLGVPMVVVNMPGAGGARGMTQLYHAAPDGYTIGMPAQTDIIMQMVEKQDYDNTKFSFIGKVQSSPEFFVVRSDSPFRGLKDFKTFGKPIRQGTHSLTSPSTLASIIISKREGWPLVTVAGYKSCPEAGLGLLRGEVEYVSCVLSGLLSYVKSGQMRPIMTLDEKRDPNFPDVPAVGELGHKDLGIFNIAYWLTGPPGVPKERLQILEEALMKTLKDPEFLKWAKVAGVDVSPGSGEEAKKLALNFFTLLEQFKGDIEKIIKK